MNLSSLIAKTYKILGGIHFALFLIATTALMVIAGTLIESKTQSHLFASQLTYSNPLFALLIWGFFINILFSATRRYPFKVKHIPFLITHLGLLMILAGVLIKHYFGTQGSMNIVEGSASDRIFETGSYAIQIVDANNHISEHPLDLNAHRPIASTKDGLQLSLQKSYTHSTERLTSWFKGDFLTISGLSPISIYEFESSTSSSTIPVTKVRFNPDPEAPAWQVYAIRTNSMSDVVKQLYLQNVRIKTTDRFHPSKTLSNQYLKDVLEIDISLPFSPVTGFDSPRLLLNTEAPQGYPINCQIDLDGPAALLNQNILTPYLGGFPLAFDLTSPTILAFIEDEHRDIHIVTIDSYGQLAWQLQRGDATESIFSYNNGFGGYAVQAAIPLKANEYDRTVREAALLKNLKSQLNLAIDTGVSLSPPLQIWNEMCKKHGISFSETFVDFLVAWDHTTSWVYPKDMPIPDSLASIVSKLDWKLIPLTNLHSCLWTISFFGEIEKQLAAGVDIMTILKQKEWPLLKTLEDESDRRADYTIDPYSTLTLLTQQIFAAADSIPAIEEQPLFVDKSPQRNAAFYSAYLRAYGIHLNAILPSVITSELIDPFLEPNEAQPLVLETPLIPLYRPMPPTAKIEDHFPLIQLQAKKGKTIQTTHIGYDRTGNGLKWPILSGEYLIRFQPVYKAIPYKLRLRTARQVNYPASTQPYSYESDLLITDQRSGEIVEKTISMNNVHETWDGYRFYLASMVPSNEGSLKRIQIIVNHDPAKYWLTYPGAIILTLGIILLFMMRPYKKSKTPH